MASQGFKKYSDGRRNNGGARLFAGRLSKSQRKDREKLYRQIREHSIEQISLPQIVEGKICLITKTRVEHMLDLLFLLGLSGDIRAVKLYLNYILGYIPNIRGPRGSYRKRVKSRHSLSIQKMVLAGQSRD